MALRAKQRTVWTRSVPGVPAMVGVQAAQMRRAQKRRTWRRGRGRTARRGKLILLQLDVEKQLPGKFEHVIWCRLSKRQRNLYEDFMASSDTQATLSSGNFLGLINVLMQLRKVCNHPELFEGRPIISSFDMAGMEVHLSSLAWSVMRKSPLEGVDLETLNLQLSGVSGAMSRWEAKEVAELKTPGALIVELASTGEDTWGQQQSRQKPSREVRSVMEEIQSVVREKSERRRRERVAALWTVNEFRCGRRPCTARTW
jgi:hypothetical protein